MNPDTLDPTTLPAAPRHEAWPKLLGQARYCGDEWPAGLLHAALVPAPIAHGELLALDSHAALALPGVLGVYGAGDLPPLRDAGVPVPWADRRIRWRGQPLAIVLADTPAAARAAAACVRAEVRAEPLIAHLAQAGDALVTPPSAGRVPADTARGDADAALANADVVHDARYHTAANVHLPMEPHVSVAAWRTGADGEPELHLHTSTQAVFITRRVIAHMLGLPRERVQVECRLIGGGFGSKGQLWWPPTAAIAQLAQRHGRPVRLELTRAEMFTLVGRRSPTRQRLRIGASRDGRLLAMVHEALHETGLQGEYCDATCAATRWLYACDAVRTAHRLARVHAPQPIPMRAPGEGPGMFALESALDELAKTLAIDPLDLRLRNLPERDPHVGLPWSSHALGDCLQRAAASFGWQQRARGLSADGRWRIGHGLASAAYPVYRQACEAEVACTAPGRYRVRCAMQDMGSGSFTALARLVADELGCSPQDVVVEIGDSALPEGPFSGGAQATGSFGPAVAQAARALRARLDAGERPQAGAPVAAQARTEPPDPAAQTHSTFAFGAVCVEVRVDVLTCEIRVHRLSAAYACGRVLDPVMVRSQAIGGLIGGIGMALHEASVTDPLTGRIVNDDFCGYLVPVHADMPAFDIQFVAEHDADLAEGIKGVGMLGTCGTAAAIANAVADATGVRLRSLPLRPEPLLSSQEA
ncbi:xanthine dehydrogenase family protein molybdopterin-binding subunit [Aquabacterium sp.]|uniref:xanthine dehydrogenase family protein molybdopterin-binding subunit n=1 Tax=Aquabacterium sp. TaxID=1872578 RepID=UPI003782E008